MAPEEDKLVRHRLCEEVFNRADPARADLAVGDERCAAREHEALERKLFGLALAITTEPSKLGQLRQMLVQLQEQREILEDFSSWAIGQIDERVMSMALEYAHDAEIMVQILSFKGGTFDGLLHAIEDLYQHEQISQRVYVKARLLLRTAGHQEAPN